MFQHQKYRPAGAPFLFLLVVLLLVSLACEIDLSATATPGTVLGGSVFSAIVWQDPDEAIDIVFAPDDDYGDMTVQANRQAFLDDVANAIDTSFYQNNVVVQNLGLFNFWFMTESGDVQAPANPRDCPIVTWPDVTDAAFAEVIFLLHPNMLRDCAWGNQVTSEPISFRTILHEASHAAFGLPDEYCCDGGYRHTPPVLYDSENACLTDPVNSSWRDCESITSTRDGRTWWRSEDSTVNIMSGLGSVVYEYGQADWVIVRARLETLNRPPVYDPTVFAPDPWDWP